MKRWKKIGLGLSLGLVAAVAGLGVWQQENIKALYTFLTNDSESISQTLQDKQQVQQESLQKDYNITVLAPSIDMSNDLLDGKLSPEEVKQSLGITQPPQQSESQPEPESKPQPQPEPTPEPESKPASQPEPAAPPVPEPPQPAPAPETPPVPEPPPVPEAPQEPELTEEERKKQLDELVNQCVAELYAREVDLMAQLGQMKQAAIDEWVALKPEERTTAKKQQIGFAGLEECYKLEVVVDGEVQEILDRYRPSIVELAGDDGVLTDLWRYYCDKKADQKAYYLDKYLD